MDGVWVFSGGGDFPAAIFTTRDLADMWIASHELSGTLTKYPLDIGLYEWALNRGAFQAHPSRSIWRRAVYRTIFIRKPRTLSL